MKVGVRVGVEGRGEDIVVAENKNKLKFLFVCVRERGGCFCVFFVIIAYIVWRSAFYTECITRVRVQRWAFYPSLTRVCCAWALFSFTETSSMTTAD